MIKNSINISALILISCGNENKGTVQQLLDDGSLAELQDEVKSNHSKGRN